MADEYVPKQISELQEALTLNDVDLFPIYQDGTAKKISGRTIKDASGESDIPEYSSSDINKVLTVVSTEETITIIQEQTVAYEGSNKDGDYGYLAEGTYDISELEDGENVTVIIDGVSHDGYVDSGLDQIYIRHNNDDPYYFAIEFISGQDPVFVVDPIHSFPHTISVTKPQTETITVVQEQTVTTEDYYVEAWGVTGSTAILPQGTYNKTLLNVGDGVTFTVNGVAYYTVAEEYGDGILIGAENFALFFNTNYFDGADAFCVDGEESGSSYTISLTKEAPATDVKPVWKEAKGGVIETTYAELKSARDYGELQPGSFYRITDYETIINGSYDLSEMVGQPTYVHYAKSAGHAFDLIVLALDESTLDENASAILHEGDTYFANSALEQWSVKYTLDNDTTKYAWADATNGKGVITYLKDEFDNEAYYDFKNVQYLAYALAMTDQSATPDRVCYNSAGTGVAYQPNRYGCAYNVGLALMDYMQSGAYESPYGIYDFACSSAILTTVGYSEVDQTYLTTFNADWYYTFDFYGDGSHQDFSVIQSEYSEGCKFNSIGKSNDYLYLEIGGGYPPLGLNGVVFESYEEATHTWACYNNKFDTGCAYILLGGNERTNEFAYSCINNILCQDCNENRFREGVGGCVLLEGCGQNLFGAGSYAIHLGLGSGSNTFGPSCGAISTGNYFIDNTFGKECERNTFGDYCSGNTLGYKCTDNTFDNSCSDNIFGAECSSNSLGTSNIGVVFGAKCTGNTLGNGCNGCVFGYECDDNTLENSCYGNIFGDGCDSNSFGASSYGNILGNYCSSNTLGTTCQNNTFAIGCSNNNISNNFSENRMIGLFGFNTIGAGCSNNIFGHRFLNNSVCAYVSSSIFGTGISYIAVVGNNVGALNSAVYYHICDKVSGTQATPLSVTVSASRTYETYVGYNSSGVLKEWCPADLVP